MDGASTDDANANRGFIGTLQPCVVRGNGGKDVWNADSYKFLQGNAPPTVNKKLWAHSRLNAIHGLFQVIPGIFQIRGFDISNMTILEGQSGVIVIDPLISTECAAAALELYESHRGKRPVVGVIYSHSHADHYGGASGILPTDEKVPIIAPSGFMEEAVSENVLAGPAMVRRAGFMYGVPLPKSAEGQVGVGIGMAISVGTPSLVPPNTAIHETGQELEIDGVRIVFQMVPGTEAPAEFNFYLPDCKALYISECATHSMHNIITLRGAQVRDAKAWANHLDETIELYGDESQVLFAGHHWPTWGNLEILQLISEQRDLYAYMHDQTLRLMNLGLNGAEIAERLELPPRLREAAHCQGFYGSLSHNVRGIYQRYMSWFDGNPARLWQHPPTEEGRRYVECFGGVDELLKKAEVFVKAGDLRFAATLLDHAVKAEPDNKAAKLALAGVFEQLGFGAENSTWRNFYLTGALELRYAPRKVPPPQGSPALNPLGTVEQWLNCLSIYVDGAAAAGESITLLIRDSQSAAGWVVSLSNGALSYRHTQKQTLSSASLALTLTQKELFDVLNGDIRQAQSKCTDSCEPLERLLRLCSVPVKNKTLDTGRL